MINIKHEKSVLSDLKPIKTGKILITAYCFGCKDYTKTFRPEKVNMTNKVVTQKKLTVLFVNLISQDF